MTRSNELMYWMVSQFAFIVLLSYSSTIVYAQSTIIIPEKGLPSISDVSIIQPNCNGGGSTLLVEAVGEHLEFILNGEISLTTGSFDDLPVGCLLYTSPSPRD